MMLDDPERDGQERGELDPDALSPVWSADDILRASISAGVFAVLFILFLFALAKAADKVMTGGAL